MNREHKYNSLKNVIDENRKKYSIVGDEVLNQALEDAFNEEIAAEEIADFVTNAVSGSQ